MREQGFTADEGTNLRDTLVIGSTVAINHAANKVVNKYNLSRYRFEGSVVTLANTGPKWSFSQQPVNLHA